MPIKLHIRRPEGFIEFERAAIFKGIHERIEDQVRLYPQHLALKTRDAAYTYSTMNGFANSLATEILSTCGTRMAQAAILLPNTPECMIAILASLKAHKAYVPLDPGFPLDRLHGMLADSEPVVLLTTDQHMGLAEQLAGSAVQIINISDLELRAGAPDLNVACDPLDRAYILYTSGTTGRPKGIEFVHRNLLHNTMCETNALYWSPSDRVTWLHSASFASTALDVYCCLANGGTLYPWNVKAQGFSGLADWLLQEQVSTMQWIPSAFRHFLRTVPEEFVFPDFRLIVLGGETVTIREVELFRRHFQPGSYLVNQIGTSEAGNCRVYAVDHHIPLEHVHVAGGYPISEDREALILDPEHRPVAPGVVGEIGIKSAYMAVGYWRDDSLTQAKFIRVGSDEIPVYLTGDLGQITADDCLLHLGRSDFQVKIRGYRVELEEVEHSLSAAPGVADAAAWIVKNRRGEDQLVAYVLLKDVGVFDQLAVEAYVESRLPDYMVPRHYVVLDRFPVVPTGKIDRNGLPNPFEGTEEPSVQPSARRAASIGQDIVALFEDLLQLQGLDLSTDFVTSGGDSLLIAVLIHGIHERFNVHIPFDAFLELPTAGQLALLVQRALRDGNENLSRGVPAAPGVPSVGRDAEKNRTSGQLRQPPEAFSGQKNLVIIGAGKSGREIYTWAAHAIAAGLPLRIKGFLDSRSDVLDGYDYDSTILGDVDSYQIDEADVFIGAVGDPQDKINYYSPILARGGKFINLIHPSAIVGKNAHLGSGIVVAPFAVITADVSLGDHVTVGSFSNIGHDVVIEDWCQISSHCGVNGGALLDTGSFLGSHACVIPGITIGAWAFVGAGSVVIRDVGAHSSVFGNPAAPIARVKSR